MTTPAPALAPAPGWPLLTRAAAPLWCTAPAASAAIAPDARTSAKDLWQVGGAPRAGRLACRRLLSAVVGGGAHERPRPLCSRPWTSRVACFQARSAAGASSTRPPPVQP